jgi:hypothetical protein
MSFEDQGQGQFNPLEFNVQKVVLSKFEDNSLNIYQVTANYSSNQWKFRNLTFKVKVMHGTKSI